MHLIMSANWSKNQQSKNVILNSYFAPGNEQYNLVTTVSAVGYNNSTEGSSRPLVICIELNKENEVVKIRERRCAASSSSHSCAKI